MHLTTFLFALLPQLRGFRLDHILITDRGVALELTSARWTACCPLYSRRSHRVHSRYERTLIDLPWAGRSVTLHLHVRRFFCANRRCPRRIFAEQRPDLVAPRARRTQALQSRLLDLACALGGQAGVRLAQRHGVRTSRATLLRLVHRAPLPPVGTPRVVGVDDWRQRRGHSYGTILVDADQRRPVELLPDRTAASLAEWLHGQPSVAIVTRDRSATYAEGAARGAPQAVQVADRFHVLDDLGDAVERVLDRHRSALRELTLPSSLATVGVAGDQDADRERAPGSSLGRLSRQQRKQHDRRALRMERYARLQVLKQQGWTIGAIAHALGISRRTVERWNRVDGFPERKPRRRPPNPLAPYADYLVRRWNEGCHTGLQLWREVCAQGYRGPQDAIWPVLHRLRQGYPPIKETDPQWSRRLIRRPPSPRRMAGVWLRRAADRTQAEHQALERLLDRCPEARLAFSLTERFTSLLRDHQADALEPWLEDAATSGLPEFHSFTSGLRRDHSAISAAISLPYSNGQTEGQITKLKLLKRSMYGRASFELLRRRVLLAA